MLLLFERDSVTRFFLQVFFLIHLSPKDNIWVSSNFFENSWRYAQVNVHHQYQGHRGANLPPILLVLLIHVANCQRCQQYQLQISRWHWWQVATVVKELTADTLKWTTGKNFTLHTTRRCLKIFSICRRWHLHWWCTLSCEYLREFSKKIRNGLMVYSGAWGKLIHEKNLKSKISWHCPCKPTYFHKYLVEKCYKCTGAVWLRCCTVGPSSNPGSAPLEEALYRADAMRIARGVLYE